MKKKIVLMTLLLNLNAFAQDSNRSGPSPEEVIGLSEQQLLKIYPESEVLDRSFHLLVTKHLHPYRIPSEHKLLRLGRAYVVFELKSDKVIAIHKISG